MNKSRTPKAFSLTELAIVILIIGIAIAGISSATRLVYEFRVNSARSLTAASPVNSIRGLVVWFESTSDNSFIDTEESNNEPISTWNDINPQQNFKYALKQNNATRRPTYLAKGQTAGLPLVQFYSVPSMPQSMFTTENLDLNGNPNFTIFFIASATNNSTAFSRLFSIGDTSFACSQFDFSYWGNNTGNLRFYGGNKTFSMFSSNMLASFRIVRDAVSGASTVNGSSTLVYFNGAMKVAGNRATEDCTPYITPAPFALNPDVPPSSTEWTTQIGEIIIFNRILKKEEIADIESYLSRKWSIKFS
jgi:prepilin-type N-terminal cleavage/methylation domain-containing protein